jgi:pimeloyl-ACP methyl ester carboxylesterase
MHKTIRAPTLEIAYLESRPANGTPIILMHGWPLAMHD